MSDQEKGAILEALKAEPEVRRVDAPSYYSSSLQASWASNDVTITFGRAAPAFIAEGPLHGKTIGQVEPQAIIQMSPQTAKDLLILLTEGLRAHEERYGEIRTDFSIERAK